MGTDIHLYLEGGIENQWQALTPEESLYDDRNYNLFAMLANGFGFAGVKTGEDFTPVAMPKGFPEDASTAIKQAWEQGGDHTAFYLSVEEFIAYDWEGQHTANTRLVTMKSVAEIIPKLELFFLV